MSRSPVSDVDVVVVSYNSADHLRDCVDPLSRQSGVNVIVVDNASTDGSIGTVADLPVQTIDAELNGGFAKGCNIGWRSGSSPYVLFLNPDARIDAQALRRLVSTLEERLGAGIVAPRIVGEDGSLQYSLRRFPRLRSTYAQALYLHRFAPTASWTDEIVRTPEHYERPGRHEWVSGACLLVRRSVLDRLGGWDSGFFLYCEDIDLCRRVNNLGLEVYYEPAAIVVHLGGASAPRSSTLPILAASRVRYAFLHRSRPAALLECAGIGLEALTRFLTFREGRSGLAGHARSLRVALTPYRERRSTGNPSTFSTHA